MNLVSDENIRSCNLAYSSWLVTLVSGPVSRKAVSSMFMMLSRTCIRRRTFPMVLTEPRSEHRNRNT